MIKNDCGFKDTGIEIEKWFEYFTKKEQNEAAAKFGMIIEGKVTEKNI